MSAEQDLPTAARELYGLPLSEFIPARDARAREADERSFAAAIRALRKPSIAAHVVNLFAQQRGTELGEVLQLAAELREAQAELDAPSLAKLGRERRVLTRRLAERAGELARARGVKVTAGTLDAVQQTISAAFFDEGAALAVASGRLVRELEPATGLGIEPDDVVGGGAAAVGEGATPPVPVDEVAERRRRRQAERRAQEAEEALVQAKRAHAGAEKKAADARERVQELASERAELERRLAHARQEGKRAATAVDEAEHDVRTAAEVVGAAERAASDARRDLDAR